MRGLPQARRPATAARAAPARDPDAPRDGRRRAGGTRRPARSDRRPPWPPDRRARGRPGPGAPSASDWTTSRASSSRPTPLGYRASASSTARTRSDPTTRSAATPSAVSVMTPAYGDSEFRKPVPCVAHALHCRAERCSDSRTMHGASSPLSKACRPRPDRPVRVPWPTVCSRATRATLETREAHATGRPRRRTTRCPDRRHATTSTSPTRCATSTSTSSAPAAWIDSGRWSTPASRRATVELRRRADRGADRTPAPDPVHRAELLRPRGGDRSGRPGRADPVHQVTQHPGRAVRRRPPAPRRDQTGLGGGARHRDRPAHQLPRQRSTMPGTPWPGSSWSTTSASAPSSWSAAASGPRASRPRPSTRLGRGSSRPTRSTTSSNLDMWLDVNGVRRRRPARRRR